MHVEPSLLPDRERQTQDWWRRQHERRRGRARARAALAPDLLLVSFVVLLFGIVIVGALFR